MAKRRLSACISHRTRLRMHAVSALPGTVLICGKEQATREGCCKCWHGRVVTF
jgi:hypothetical protein